MKIAKVLNGKVKALETQIEKDILDLLEEVGLVKEVNINITVLPSRAVTSKELTGTFRTVDEVDVVCKAKITLSV